MGLDEKLVFQNISISRQVGFAMLASRYSFPRRYGDTESIFHMHPKNIGKVCTGMENLLFEKMKYGIQFNSYQFREENLRKFAAAIDKKGALLPNVVGFIDGTLQQFFRPSTDDEMQKSLYNGWKHSHAIKYQAIVTPDGITSSIVGPVIGARHDKVMFIMFETERRLQKYLKLSEDDKDNFATYGDPAYQSSEHMHCPFPTTSTDKLEIQCNKSMSKVRIAVEWEFGEVMKYFKFSKYKYAMKTAGNNPAKIYILSTVFKNMLHCARQGGYPTFGKCNLKPPTLEEYIYGMRREKIEGEDDDM